MKEGLMNTSKRINLNADMGESFGRYVLGNDEALIPYVPTVHIACGYHAADPGELLREVRLAKKHGAEIGAHVAYPDLMGFGRRRMELSEDEVFEICVYPIGALLGFCRAEGVPLNHVKPHGHLYQTAVHDAATARGIVRAVKAVDPQLLLLMYGDIVAAECEAAGVRMVHEGYVDQDYRPDSTIVVERIKKSRTPEFVAEATLSILRNSGRKTVDGGWLPITAQSICVHGDGPNVVELAKMVRKCVTDDGHRIVPLREL